MILKCYVLFVNCLMVLTMDCYIVVEMVLMV